MRRFVQVKNMSYIGCIPQKWLKEMSCQVGQSRDELLSCLYCNGSYQTKC